MSAVSPFQHDFDARALDAFSRATGGSGWNDESRVQKRELGHVVRLHLSGTNLTGSIPDLGTDHPLAFAELRELDLSHNGLTGAIPSWLGRLKKLEKLNLSHNAPSGPEHGGRAGPSDPRYRDSTGFTGPIPAELGDLANLEELRLNANHLTGTIPDLSRLTDLKLLALEVNRLSDSIPGWLGALKNLEKLNLSWNNMTGTIPRQLGRLSELTELALGNNKELGGAIPPEIGALSKLKALWLRNTSLEGPLPESLTGLEHLRRFYYRDTDLYVPDHAGLRAWLQGVREHVGMGDREILIALFEATGGPTAWDNSENWKSGKPVGTWYGVETDADGRVVRLQLDRNGLAGTIPRCVGGLSLLRGFHVELNRLTGSIPSDLGNLTRLETLNLSHNRLSGGVPPEFGQLPKLRILAVGNNGLSGEIAAPEGSFLSLDQLWMRNSGLDDPSAFSRLFSVRRS